MGDPRRGSDGRVETMPMVQLRPNRTLRIAAGAVGEPGVIELCEHGRTSDPSIEMREESVDIGCTTVSRGVIEKLAAAFKENFPIGTVRKVKIQ